MSDPGVGEGQPISPEQSTRIRNLSQEEKGGFLGEFDSLLARGQTEIKETIERAERFSNYQKKRVESLEKFTGLAGGVAQGVIRDTEREGRKIAKSKLPEIWEGLGDETREGVGLLVEDDITQKKLEDRAGIFRGQVDDWGRYLRQEIPNLKEFADVVRSAVIEAIQKLSGIPREGKSIQKQAQQLEELTRTLASLNNNNISQEDTGKGATQEGNVRIDSLLRATYRLINKIVEQRLPQKTTSAG